MNRSQWTVNSEQRSVNSEQRSLIIEHWYWCEYVCVRRRGDLQIALCCCVCFSLNSPIFQIRPHFKFAPITNRPHVEGLIAHILSCASSLTLPLHGCYQDVHKYACKYKKRRHGLGMRAFTCVVEANWNSPPFQNSPILQFALCCCMRFFLKSPPFQIRPHFKFAHSKSPLG